MADNAIVTSSSIPFEYVSKENFAISSLLNDTSGNIDNIGLGDTARSNDILYNHTLDINSDSISIVDNMSKHVISYSMKCPVTSIVHDTYLIPVSCTVKDINDKFTFLNEEISNSISIYMTPDIVYKNMIAVCTHNSGHAIMVPYTKSEVNVFETVDLSVLKIHEDTSYCQQFEKVILDDVLFVPPVFSVAADYKPPSMGNSGSGNGIKFIKLYAQKYSYTEIVLDFTERKLIDVVGLPSGMMLELGSIKGSCSVSGSFPLILKMDNNTTLDALFIVPEIPRKI